MPIISWSDNYSVGIPSIDSQHQIWIGLINKLHEAMSKGEGKKVQADILAEVINYTKTHFSSEEVLFDNHNYPEKDIHKNIHKGFVKNVLELQENYESGKALISIELMNMLKTWLLDHISNVDKKYSDYLTSKGVK